MTHGHPDTPAAALMARYCDGEPAAFLPLYDLLAPDVFDRLLDRTGDKARAEVLLQRTFLQLHQRRSSYVRGADPLPWAIAIAEHLAAARQDRTRPVWILRTIGRLGRSSRSGSSRPTENA